MQHGVSMNANCLLIYPHRINHVQTGSETRPVGATVLAQKVSFHWRSDYESMDIHPHLTPRLSVNASNPTHGSQKTTGVLAVQKTDIYNTRKYVIIFSLHFRISSGFYYSHDLYLWARSIFGRLHTYLARNMAGTKHHDTHKILIKEILWQNLKTIRKQNCGNWRQVSLNTKFTQWSREVARCTVYFLFSLCFMANSSWNKHRPVRPIRAVALGSMICTRGYQGITLQRSNSYLKMADF